jgi:hypothetical protein
VGVAKYGEISSQGIGELFKEKRKNTPCYRRKGNKDKVEARD